MHASSTPWRLAGAALALVAAAAPAVAQSRLDLTGRLSVNHLYYFGGFAVSSDEGADGAPPPSATDLKTGIPVTSLQPATLAIAGRDHHDIRYLSWTGTLDETWDQQQTWSLADLGSDLQLAAAGHARITQTSQVCGPLTGCSTASELHWSTNGLALDFTLDAPTDITLQGSTSGGQWVQLLRWVPAAGGFTFEVHGPSLTRDTDFLLQRSLQPGLYRVVNNDGRFVGGAVDVSNSWHWTLTLHDTVSAVSEPPPGLLLAAGLGWLGCRARRRQAGRTGAAS